MTQLKDGAPIKQETLPNKTGFEIWPRDAKVAVSTVKSLT